MKNLKTNTALFGSIKAKDANGLHLQDDGGNGMFIEDGGKVGIGTTNPSAALEVNGAWDSQLRISRDVDHSQYSEISGGASVMKFKSVSNTHSLFSFVSNDENEEVERMRIDTAGNVGIGTTNPVGKLHVTELSVSIGDVTVTNTGTGVTGGTNLNTKISNGDRIKINGEIFTVSSVAATTLTLSGTPSTAGTFTAYTDSNGLVVTIGGKVGIGTTNPSAPLTICGSPYPYMSFDNNQTDSVDDVNLGALFFKGRQPDGSLDTGAAIRAKGAGTASNGNNDVPAELVFSTNPGGNGGLVERMVINKSGNVGIGTANPAKQLVVYNSTASVQQFRVESDHTGSGWGGLSAFSQKNGTLSRNIAVGAYRPETNVNPCALVQWQSRDGGVAYLWMDDSNALRLGTNSGHIGSTNGTSLGTAGTSDERLKNIEDVFEYGLSHVLQLKPIAFTFKKDAQQVRKLGFGAQTSQSVVPESVYDSGNCIDGYDAHPEHEGMNVAKSDDNELGMEYVQLIPVLTKAIQEQQQIIEDLKSQNESLVARIEALEG